MTLFKKTLWPMVFVVGIVVMTAWATEGNPAPAAESNNKDVLRLEDLDLRAMQQSWYQPGKAVTSMDQKPLTIAQTVYTHGVGTNSRSEMIINLKKAALEFTAMVGIDDYASPGAEAVFEVWVDGRQKARVVRKYNQPAEPVTVDLKGAETLFLLVLSVDNNTWKELSDWADAVIKLAPDARERPEAALFADTESLALAKVDNERLAINGPMVIGATPGKPFLFLIPATGRGPLTYRADDLPAGLSLNANTGIITGVLQKDGKTEVELKVSGPQGKVERKLLIVAGDRKLALTPPMGWNSWNVWACAVDDAKVRAGVEAMVSSGLAAHGYQYVNIDDCWQGARDSNGKIMPNEKFPNMKALTEYGHSKGIKMGIYSSPGPKTCAQYEGSLNHEQQDVHTWAEWGFDYIKYDWCSYVAKDWTLPEIQKPYVVLRQCLDNAARDIVFSLCQYGMLDVWKWGAQIGGNAWRTTGDITDNWVSMSDIGFSQFEMTKYAGPGHWNDPDMLVIGHVGWGPSIHPTNLTPNEQVTHITLWCMQAAPLLIGCDMTKFDDFTRNLMCNDEVLAVDQDPLGKAATRIFKKDGQEIWTRPLADGTLAVAMFNRSRQGTEMRISFSGLGLEKDKQHVRDLWQQKDCGKLEGYLSARVPGHGVKLFKVGKPKKIDLKKLIF